MTAPNHHDPAHFTPPPSILKQSAQRLGRRSLWILPIILALLLLLKGADFVWFRTQLPTDFADANWNGKWQTEKYWSVSGRLLVILPDPLPENEDFEAKALVYYPICSPYKTGQFVRMDFQGRFTPESATSSGHSTSDVPAGGGKLSFKGKIGSQMVEYVSMLTDTRKRIVGSYISTSPDDLGYFYIAKP